MVIPTVPLAPWSPVLRRVVRRGTGTLAAATPISSAERQCDQPTVCGGAKAGVRHAAHYCNPDRAALATNCPLHSGDAGRRNAAMLLSSQNAAATPTDYQVVIDDEQQLRALRRIARWCYAIPHWQHTGGGRDCGLSLAVAQGVPGGTGDSGAQMSAITHLTILVNRHFGKFCGRPGSGPKQVVLL